MTGDDLRKIFVLTDTPGIYGETLNRDECVPVFVKDAETLIARLKDEDSGGLVLEVGKVMKAGRRERDRIFAFSTAFPVMRTRINARNGYVDYLDSLDAFFNNLETATAVRIRNHERKQVELPCFLSKEDDPSMAETMEGIIYDISAGGCFACTPGKVDGEAFLHIRIPALGNSRPIYSSVRWGKTDDNDPGTHCMGIMFIDPAEAQIKDIETLSSKS